MSDIINARSLALPSGPVTPIGDWLTTSQIARLAQQLRDDLAEATAEQTAARKAGYPFAPIARRIAATRASLFELEAR